MFKPNLGVTYFAGNSFYFYNGEERKNIMKIKVNISPKEYSPPVYGPDIQQKCCKVEKMICEQPDKLIMDIVEEVALSDAYLPTDDELFSILNSRFIRDYILRAFEHFDLRNKGLTGFELINECIKRGVYLYYSQYIFSNLATILTNVLIGYLKNADIVSDKKLNDEDFEDNIRKYIRNILRNPYVSAGFFIEQFKLFLLIHLKVEVAF